MKKGIQIIIMVFLMLIILGGGFYILLALGIVPAPAFVSSLPVIGSHLGAAADSDYEPTGLASDPASSVDSLIQKQKEIEDLNLKLDTLQNKLDESDKTAVIQEQKIAELTAEIDKKANSGAQAGYSQASKDLAEYYAEMKGQDASAILTLLRDEEIISIIQHMPKDTAAEVLRNFETSRAAEITRKMMAVSSD